MFLYEKRVAFNRTYAVKRYTLYLNYIKKEELIQRIFLTKIYIFPKYFYA